MDEATAPLATNHLPPGAGLLELSGDRVVTFRVGKFAYTYYFPRLTAEDWNRYFDGIYVASSRHGKEQRTVVDLDSAGAELVQSKVVRVEGYGNCEAFLATPDWRERLPFGHVRAVASLLCEVQVSRDESETPFDPDAIDVTLEALWGEGGAAPTQATMRRFPRLAHRFSPPSAEQRRKYTRATSESRVRGGFRQQQTIYPARQRVLLGFYDELITSIAGYAVAGRPLSTAEDARREMDSFHKVAAVGQLFDTPDIGQAEDQQPPDEEAAA